MTGSAARRVAIIARLAGDDASGATSRLCEVCADVTATSGAGIMLMSGDSPRGSVCTTDDVSALIEQLQYDLGEGPCIDAHREGRPVSEPDLAAPELSRWMAFTGPAVAAGARAVFGFPMQVGAVRLGALNLYSRQPGPLTDEQHADAVLMADIAAQTVLVVQADAPQDTLAAELDHGSNFQYVVHQASGMVAAQLGVSVDHALIRLRAYAFGNDRRLTDVARDVVALRLRFDTTDERDQP